MSRSIAAVLLLTLSTPVLAGSPPKKPWEWTLEERLALRFDPAHIQARQALYEADYPQSKGQHRFKPGVTNDEGREVPGAIVYGIDGRRNPELFLPHELFSTLLSGFTPDLALRQKQRDALRHGVRSFYVDEKEFWSRLEGIASRAVVVKYAPYESKNEPAAKRRERLCISHGALQEARREFLRFDEFLYTVIAPWSQISEATSFSDPTARLRDAEKGCQ